MNRILIIGNSAAGFSAAKTLAASSAAAKITVLTQENCLPYNKCLLLDFLRGSVEEKGLFLCEEVFYRDNNIELVKGASVSRIEEHKQRVCLKDNTRISYDFLIIASGRKTILPDIPGKTKNGVFTLYNLEQFEAVRERLQIIDSVCIIADSGTALGFHEAISKTGKHIKVIASPKPADVELPQNSEWIADSTLTEIIGEGAELKAYKLSSGKAIEASLILFAGNYKPCTEFLKDSQIRAEDGYIIVDELMHTNLDNIFACGSVCCLEDKLGESKSWEESCNEGVIVAKNLIASLERGSSLCQQTS